MIYAYTGKPIEILHISTIKCLLTPVGHEDFHSSVLQQVSSGKDGTDLCEQPFSMETFCISKNLGEQTENQKVGYIWFEKGQERGHRRTQFRTGKGGSRHSAGWDHFSLSDDTDTGTAGLMCYIDQSRWKRDSFSERMGASAGGSEGNVH